MAGVYDYELKRLTLKVHLEGFHVGLIEKLSLTILLFKKEEIAFFALAQCSFILESSCIFRALKAVHREVQTDGLVCKNLPQIRVSSIRIPIS